MVTDYVPKEESRRALSAYLSELTITDERGSGIRLPETNKPEGFHLIHRRCSRRSLFEISEGFAIIFSKERSWRGDRTKEESRESVMPNQAIQNYFRKIRILSKSLMHNTE